MVQVSKLVGQEWIYKQLSDGVVTQREIDMFEERRQRRAGADLVEDSTDGTIEARNEQHGMDIDTEQDSREQVVPPPTPLLHDINPFARDSTPTLPMQAIRRPALPVSTELFLSDHPLDTEIELIGCASDAQCLQALQRLDDQLNRPDKDLIDRIDQLVMSLAVRLRALTSEVIPEEQVATVVGGKSRLCRYVCNALVLLMPEGVAKVREETLECLLSSCLIALLSRQINTVFEEDREQLVKALNVLLVKALEGSHPNKCYRVLLSLLTAAFIPGRDGRGSSGASSADKYPELVMKCLWKETKGLGAAIDTQIIDICALLVDIDRFLRTTPPMEWKARAAQDLPYQDLPLRTVKTIIHEVTGRLQTGTRSLLAEAGISEDSFVYSYCRQFVEAAGLCWEEEEVTGHDAEDADDSENSGNKLDDFELEQRLKTICDCICSKPDTRMVHTQM
jgi:hypothetical protein